MAKFNSDNLVPPLPPVPPIPPIHHPSAQPNEVPHIVPIKTQGRASPEYLINCMNRLHVQTERASNKNSPRAEGLAAMDDIDAGSPLLYLGYTFVKATPAPGKKSTWGQIERAKMHLSQSELMNLVASRNKRIPVAEQYHSLSKVKRAHVDQLIHELKSGGPRFEWTCVYVKEDEKPFKGKNHRRGDYETVSLDVIILKKAATLVYPTVWVNEPVERTNPTRETFQTPTPHGLFSKEPKIGQAVPLVDSIARKAAPVVHREPAVHQGSAVHQATSISVPDVHQTLPSKPNNVQVPPPPPQHPIPTGAQQPTPQQWAAWMQQAMPASAHQQHRPSVMLHDPTTPSAGHGTHTNIPQMPAMWADPRGASVAQGPVHRGPTLHSQSSPLGHPEMQEMGKTRLHTPTYPTPEHTNMRIPVTEPETDSALESSSVDDVESEFDFEDELSVSEDSDGELETEESRQPWRGSLYRRHSTSSAKQTYRTHCRKQPPKGILKPGTGRSGSPAGPIDVIPAKSHPTDPRVIVNREVTRLARDRPKIIQAPVPPKAVDMQQLLDERMGRYEGGRMRNDIRTRMLDDREARLEHRERLLDLKARVLQEEWDNGGYLPRRLSLRDSGSFYSRRYRPLDDLR
ncbi:uncharacterized protein BP01DRAFT_361477 [Aspergillus saccharolyticus JOP 1030-1]|uniref:Uncharacterized protein n=1 Tax=Aspergillus saccharolyticus JOP 1030-1 TaxID=1450539 RepID=A0A318ZXQ3_9EURO|nr:hypothetical protein BP01DRAFT_361477 [Aspergillus saccharolyticus JOP 1030-1]PYH40192.1 hypothetical protein BP01DRAFT_361477 [Aspergillus saccharolyticus JOP 1030-1]